MKKKTESINIYGSLPPTRKSEFFDIVKNRFAFLLRIGLVLLLSFLPLLVVFYFKNRFSILALASMQEEGADIASIRLGYSLMSLLFLGFDILSYLFVFLGLAGSMKIIKLLAYQEPPFFWSDFFSGIKENWGQSLLLSLFFSFPVSIADCSLSLARIAEMEALSYLAYAAIGVLFFILFPALLIAMSMNAVYKNSFGTNLKGGFQLSLAHYWPYACFSLLALAVFAGIEAMNVFVSIWVDLGTYVLIIVLLLPFYLLASHLYSLYLFDSHINKDYPEICQKGLASYYLRKEE